MNDIWLPNNNELKYNKINELSKQLINKLPSNLNTQLYPLHDKNNDQLISYGVIMFTIKNNELYFLLTQNRNTFSYIDFLRGNYTIYDMPRLFYLMTNEERNRFNNYDFKILWDNLWINHNCKLYHTEYNNAYYKYNNIKPLIKFMLENTKSYINMCEWGFPKGKCINDEKYINCAIREFKEETNLTKIKFKIIRNNIYNDNKYFTIMEEFIGSNNKLYKNIYYLFLTNDTHDIKYIYNNLTIDNKIISLEMKDMKWVKLKHISKYLIARKRMLIYNANKQINNDLNYFSLFINQINKNDFKNINNEFITKNSSTNC